MVWSMAGLHADRTMTSVAPARPRPLRNTRETPSRQRLRTHPWAAGKPLVLHPGLEPCVMSVSTSGCWYSSGFRNPRAVLPVVINKKEMTAALKYSTPWVQLSPDKRWAQLTRVQPQVVEKGNNSCKHGCRGRCPGHGLVELPPDHVAALIVGAHIGEGEEGKGAGGALVYTSGLSIVAPTSPT